MTIHLYHSRQPGKANFISPSVLFRAALTVAAFTMAIVPVFAANLRGDVTASSDVLTLGDLVEGVTGPIAARPLFRAPALGESGTIQVKRIVDAATGLGIKKVETAGRIQINVTRSAPKLPQPGVKFIQANTSDMGELVSAAQQASAPPA